MKRALLGSLIAAAFVAGWTKADAPQGWSLPIQNAGTAKGAVGIFNCDGTTITCTLGSGKVTISGIAGATSNVAFTTYAALPATCTAGQIFFFTDATPYTRADCTATNTFTFRHNSAAMTLPPAVASLTWVNQNASGSAANTNGALVMTTNVTASCCSAQLLVEATPSTPYSYASEIIPSASAQNSTNTNLSGQEYGLVIRDSGGGKFSSCSVLGTTPAGLTEVVTSFIVRFDHWTNATTGPTQLVAVEIIGFVPPVLKIRDDGTNHYCYYSLDEGLHFSEVYQESRTTFVPSGGNQTGFVQMQWEMLAADTANIDFLSWNLGN